MSDTFDIGDRLKKLRLSAGLSQRQLAQYAAVPHGQISMLETNRSSPSVARLRKITASYTHLTLPTSALL